MTDDLISQKTMLDTAVSISAAVSQKRPVAAHLLDPRQIHLGEHERFVLGGFGDHDPERVADERVTPEFDAGALAYAVKTAHPEDVAATVRQTFDHTIFLAKTAATNGGSPSSLPPVVAGEGDEDVALTRREREILALVAEGHSNRELARMLWVTEQTVKFHLSNIYRKLDVANRTEASRWAHRNGLVGSATAVPLPVSA